MSTEPGEVHDPGNGRFLEVDPQEEEVGDYDLSDYIYAEDDPTLLTDPSGLDPRFHGKTLNCKKNKLLCKFIYGQGYKDGCRGYLVRKTLSQLAWRGIYLEHILKAANKKGTLVNSTDGPKGPGLYFVNYGDGTTLIEPPQDQECGWICSVGLATTQVFGCDSSRGCVMQAALFFAPVGTAAKLMRARPWLQRSLMLAKGTKAMKAIAGAGKAGKVLVTAAKGAIAARKGFGGLSRAGEFGIQRYNQLIKALKGTGLQSHHLLEKRFATVLGVKSRQMLSIAVTAAEHQIFTNRWRSEISYGAGTLEATKESVLNAARRIYSDYPAILKALNL